MASQVSGCDIKSLVPRSAPDMLPGSGMWLRADKTVFLLEEVDQVSQTRFPSKKIEQGHNSQKDLPVLMA